jgi:circadian clock protein KaiB
MKPRTVKEQSGHWEKTLLKTAKEKYSFRLYVTGATPKSNRAITNIKRICETHLKGRYSLEIIDIYQQPELARGAQIIAAPTLIKRLPLPLRKFIGDMADGDRILLRLDLEPARKSQETNGKAR